MIDFKREYIKMRNSKQYELEFFYNYFISKVGIAVDPNEFTEKFLYTHIDQQTPPGYPKITMRTGEVDRNSVLSFLDGVFQLTILNDKEGNFIKVVE